MRVAYLLFNTIHPEKRIIGRGYVNGNNLITYQNGVKRVYRDCIEFCTPIKNRDGEYTGEFIEYYHYGTTAVDYTLWYKKI